MQGVGFRPFVYQLAHRHQLKGWVCNTSEGVNIEVEGEEQQLESFLEDLKGQAPPASYIENITFASGDPEGYQTFEIRHSVTEAGKYQLVSPDIATCSPCQVDFLEPTNRRFRYPFTNCTNCGPRFTIIKDMPYDRPNTTMDIFKMCPECQAEYDNPLDRRFHAQPNACPVCGPSLSLVDENGAKVETSDAIISASEFLKQDKIVAVKGLGGFLLACDATSDTAVQRLRQRKHRPFKPFAIMVRDIEEAKRYCDISLDEKRLLISAQAPIVLLRWKGGSPLAPSAAPNLKYMGVMLPYTPLHYLLMREVNIPLVMTSGNISEEPIAGENAEALRRLNGIADYFLLHNRDIYIRYDDSVAIVEIGQPQLLRRARGYAPYPIHLPFHTRQTLACGPELKNTFCLTRDDHAFVSQHIGDMENLETLQYFESTVDLYKKLFRVEPEIIACDLHPDYLATKYARELVGGSSKLQLVGVQHHHAHIVSCMVENNVSGPVIGVALDGTGYGADGTIWGGEFLVVDYGDYRRAGHLQYVPLPGGAAAIERPYRMALSYLLTLVGPKALKKNLPLFGYTNQQEIIVIRKQIEQGLNAPLTSSCGRLFDAISALIGVRGRVDYEGQAAIEMEMLATGVKEGGCYPFSILEKDNIRQVCVAELFASILSDLDGGIPRPNIAAKFHNTVAALIREMCTLIARDTGLKRVALSGGVFQNRLLLRLTHTALKGAGFTVLVHKEVPTNDGCISLGQAVVANHRLSSKLKE